MRPTPATSTIETGAVTLPAAAVDRIRRALADLDVAEAAVRAAGEASSAAYAAGDHEAAAAHHRDWERACSESRVATVTVVYAVRFNVVGYYDALADLDVADPADDPDPSRDTLGSGTP